MLGTGVRVGVSVGIGVVVFVGVGVAVGTGVWVGVAVGVGSAVAVCVGAGVAMGGRASSPHEISNTPTTPANRYVRNSCRVQRAGFMRSLIAA